MPAFARQTGMACNACHFQHFPALNQFGRTFKQGGFTMVGGQSMIEGSILPNEDFEVEVGFDSTALPNGIYEASIYISSNDPDENPYIIPVTMEIIDNLTIPESLEISCENSNIILSWFDSGANSFKVFSSTETNGDFNNVSDQGVFSISRSQIIWTMPIDESVEKLFFQIRSSTD